MSSISVNINKCTGGATVRYYMNGWHYFQFNGRYEAEKISEVKGTQVVERFSAISRIEQPTSKTAKLYYNVGAEGLPSNDFEGLKGILYAETVELYLNGRWAEVEIDRSSFRTRQNQMDAYDVICRLRILNIGDIERAAIVPIPSTEPITLYYEDFEGTLPWGYTITKYNASCDVEKALVNSSNKLRATIYTDTDTQNGMLLRIELPDWEENYGYIKLRIESLMAEYFPLFSVINEGAHTRIRFNVIGYTADLSSSYATLKKTRELQHTIYSTAPVRYLELRFLSFASVQAHYAYINWILLEKL